MKNTLISLKAVLSLTSLLLCLLGTSTRAYAGCGDAAGPRVDWRYCNVENQNFSGIDFTGANFSNTVFSNVTFGDANLTDANFTDSELTNVSFVSVIFRNTVFEKVKLNEKVEFSSTQLLVKTDLSSMVDTYYLVGQNDFKFDESYSVPTIVDYIGDTNIAPIIYSQKNKIEGVASNQIVTASSGLISYITNAVDSNPETSFSTDYQTNSSPWWQIDLGAHYQLKKIIIHDISNASANSGMKDGIVMVSDWDLTPGETVDNPMIPSTNDNISRFTPFKTHTMVNGSAIYETSVGRSARFIRIQLPPSFQSQGLEFAEIELIGEFVNNVSDSQTSNDSPPPTGYEVPKYEEADKGRCESDLYDDEKLITNLEKCNATPGKNVDLSYCNLSKRVFSGVDFTGANLEGANLAGANLSNVKMNFNTNIRSANLQGVNLQGANLSDVDVQYSDLRSANFTGSNLSGLHNNCSYFSDWDLAVAQGARVISHEGEPMIETAVAINNGYGFARQSSANLSRPASLALDGDSNTASATGNDESPWWQLDMGAVYQIQSLDILPADDSSDLSDARIYISDWNFSSDPETVASVGISSLIYKKEQSLPLGINSSVAIARTGRFIRIQLPESSAQRLALTSVKVNSSTVAVAATTFQPVTDGQKGLFPETDLLGQKLITFIDEMETTDNQLDDLNTTLGDIYNKAIKVKNLADRLKTLNSRMSQAKTLLTTVATVIKPLKTSANSMKNVINTAKTPVNAASIAVNKAEEVVKPVREQLPPLSQHIENAQNQINQTVSFTNNGNNLLQEKYFCSRNTEDLNGRQGLEAFSTIAKSLVTSATSLVSPVGTSAEATDTELEALLENLTITELDNLSIELEAIELPFYQVFNPLKSLAYVFEVEIDLKLPLIPSFTVKQILEGVDSIPYLSTFESEVYKLIDPLVAKLTAYLSIKLPDLPSLANFEAEMNSLSLSYDFSGFEFFVPGFSVEFRDLNMSVFKGYQLPYCAEVPVIEMYPEYTADFDGDGLINGDEVTPDPLPYYNTDAFSPDSDNDGLNDYFEVTYGLDPNNAMLGEAELDLDLDNLTNMEEYLAGTDPTKIDTDGDGMSDDFEITYGLNPLNLEDATGKTVIQDEIEVIIINGDIDGDGLTNIAEFLSATNPTKSDSDGDGLPDEYEINFGLDPNDSKDASFDLDEDRLVNLLEFQLKTTINVADSDADGISDSVEYANGLNPLDNSDANTDLDGDTLTNIVEVELGTDITKPDTDDDGVNDNIDIFPLNSTEALDNDLDGIGNNADTDDDNDSVLDTEDAFPFNHAESIDTDGDFIGNNADTDDDNDDVLDISDAFPLDKAESVDTDGDGIGNNADTDDDNDGVIDSEDIAPLDASISDITAPTFAAIEILTVEAEGITTDVILTAPQVTDNTSNDIVITSDYLEPLTLGVHTITWTATDSANNIATAEQVITVVDTTAPVFAELQAVTMQAKGLSTNILADVQVSVTDIVDGILSATLLSTSELPSGNHVIELSAEDNAGNVVLATMEVNILPLVSVASTMNVTTGNSSKVTVRLSGQAPSYPVIINYQLLAGDNALVTDDISIKEGTAGEITVDIAVDSSEGSLTLKLIDASQAFIGSANQTQLVIIKNNIAPTLNVTISQQGKVGAVIDPDNGIVSIVASINDINKGDSHNIIWTAANNAFVDSAQDSNKFTFEIEPSSLAENTYTLNVEVNETNTDDSFTTSKVVKFVVERLVELSREADTDGDSIVDSEEGYTDSDGDGIVDYLDNDSNTTRLPTNENSAPLQTSTGLSMTVGSLIAAQGSSSKGASLSLTDLSTLVGDDAASTEDNHYELLTPLYNFIINDLVAQGDSVAVVIPLESGNVIPEGAIFRKYNTIKGWFTFVENENNQLGSASTNDSGNCPPANDESYTQGLTQGNNCIQLIIEDGGENDADFTINSSIEDPGVIVVEKQNSAPSIVLATSHQVDEEAEITLDASKTTDSENDNLTYSWVQLSGVDVELTETDKALLIFTAPSVSADESLTFELTVDDGIDTSTLVSTVTINQVNKAPSVTIAAHKVSANEGGTIVLSAQGSDADGDNISYLWKQLSGPKISIEGNTVAQLAINLPDVENDEVVEIQVTVTDGQLSASSTTTFIISNKKGSSMAWLLLLMIIALMSSRSCKLSQRL